MRLWLLEGGGGGLEGALQRILGAAGGDNGSPLARKWGLCKLNHIHPSPILCGKRGLYWTDQSTPLLPGRYNDGRGGGRGVNGGSASNYTSAHALWISLSFMLHLRLIFTVVTLLIWALTNTVVLNTKYWSRPCHPVVFLVLPHTFDTGYWHIPANSYARHRPPFELLPNPHPPSRSTTNCTMGTLYKVCWCISPNERVDITLTMLPYHCKLLQFLFHKTNPTLSN